MSRRRRIGIVGIAPLEGTLDAVTGLTRGYSSKLLGLCGKKPLGRVGGAVMSDIREQLAAIRIAESIAARCRVQPARVEDDGRRRISSSRRRRRRP
jgi:hypothetical protein